ncbi:MAG: 5-amino-6-(D-ribitylamino)uracil--L-tyrosine 4-hydroxyphenyl transferase CofH [Steroidobacteraceae bacterium]
MKHRESDWPALAATLAPDEFYARVSQAPLDELMQAAEDLTLEGFGATVSYSRKVFIPLTKLCRDVCHYCTFAKTPRHIASAYMTIDEVLDIARRGAELGCHEALLTLGDKPELRYRAAREALQALGCASTIDYLARVAERIVRDTALLPHLNPGVMSADDLRQLRPHALSMGLMLETASDRLGRRGGAHHGSPDKQPALRLESLEAAGRMSVAMTSGLLIGIGETRRERFDALLRLRELHVRHGHLQEIILQNFRAKPGTRMAGAVEPGLDEQLWIIAVARLMFGAGMSLQAPPNLQPDALELLVRAGINDWGGVSPLTPDHVNPEAPWPHLDDLDARTRRSGRVLRERLALVPQYLAQVSRWTSPQLATRARRLTDSRGFVHDHPWRVGGSIAVPEEVAPAAIVTGRWRRLQRLLHEAGTRTDWQEQEVVTLFQASGAARADVCRAADELRSRRVGETVTFVINRNINYTNICLYHCGFCAFSKGRGAASLRGPGYLLDLDEVGKRAAEAAAAGATEVCLQGGIHPQFTGKTYLDIVNAVRQAAPGVHIHAFSPLEVSHGAATLELSVPEFLARLQRAGLATLPGTAAEILCDDVRAQICPDKLDTRQWCEVMIAAHGLGLRTTATIMFGHVEQPRHWAKHLLVLRDLQANSGGFTEFVPLPFVHMEAPLWRKGFARSGPGWEETLLMHAVARLVLDPHIVNIQASWVKMGVAGVAQCLRSGANDMGGTLMNESITRAAGGVNGQMLDADGMIELARSVGREPRQRTTLYEHIDPDQVESGRCGSNQPALASSGIA